MAAPILITVAILASCLSLAQSKLVPVTRSLLTGISLPTGSKQDKRLLSTVAAQTLLEMEATEQGMMLEQNIEVLSVPPTPEGDQYILQQLASNQWLITKLNTANHYLLKSSSTTILAYIQRSKKETAVYFCTVQGMKTVPPPVTQSSPVQETIANQPAPTPQTIVSPPSANVSTNRFAFTTTNFDDGWVATAGDNWVEVMKGNVKVLIHFHTKETSSYISDYKVEDQLAWNTFIAPRYGNIAYTEGPSTIGFERPHFLFAQTKDLMSGRAIYLALFKMGQSNWMEFIAPDQNAFIQAFGVDVTRIDYYSPSVWDPLRKMNGYNKFAVAASDLTGKWSSAFSGFTNYVNVYTGATTANTHSSSEWFAFWSDGTYDWQLSTASGFVGNIKFDGAKSTGKFTMRSNWQIDFSDIEKKARLYNAYFSCERNGVRILWLQDTSYGDYTGFGKEQ